MNITNFRTAIFKITQRNAANKPTEEIKYEQKKEQRTDETNRKHSSDLVGISPIISLIILHVNVLNTLKDRN